MNEILEEIKKAAAGRSVPPAKKTLTQLGWFAIVALRFKNARQTVKHPVRVFFLCPILSSGVVYRQRRPHVLSRVFELPTASRVEAEIKKERQNAEYRKI